MLYEAPSSILWLQEQTGGETNQQTSKQTNTALNVKRTPTGFCVLMPGLQLMTLFRKVMEPLGRWGLTDKADHSGYPGTDSSPILCFLVELPHSVSNRDQAIPDSLSPHPTVD